MAEKQEPAVNSEHECEGGEHDWGEPENLGDNLWRIICRRCGAEWEEYVDARYWRSKTIMVRGKTYRALKAWSNVSLCSECNKPIFDVPLILWDNKDQSKALTFCWGCVERLKIVEELKI